jgi:hypothetical protein
MGRRGYSAEFRRRVVDLVAAGRKVRDVARDLGISEQIYLHFTGSRFPLALCRNSARLLLPA